MKLSVKSIALATMMTVAASTGVAFSANISTATPQKNHVQVNPQFKSQLPLCAEASINGNWKGGLVAAGDDAVTSVDITISPGGAIKQGTWKFVGASEILDKGNVIASVEGDTVTLQLWKQEFQGKKKIQKKIMTLKGNFKDCGKKLSGKSIDLKTTLLFNFSKS